VVYIIITKTIKDGERQLRTTAIGVTWSLLYGPVGLSRLLLESQLRWSGA